MLENFVFVSGFENVGFVCLNVFIRKSFNSIIIVQDNCDKSSLGVLEKYSIFYFDLTSAERSTQAGSSHALFSSESIDSF